VGAATGTPFDEATGTPFDETSSAGAENSAACVTDHVGEVGEVSDATPDEHSRSTSPSAHVGASGDASCDEGFHTASPATCIGAHVSALGDTDIKEIQRFAPPSTRARADADTNAAAAITLGAVPSKLDAAVLRTQAKQALVGLGWRPAIANAAVVAAMAALGAEATLERLIFEALRRCPRPTA
jgi:hypothetical protein